MKIQKQNLLIIIASLLSILISVPYNFDKFGEATESIRSFGMVSLVLGVILLFLMLIDLSKKNKSGKTTKNSLGVILLILAIIQIGPSILWFLFNNTPLTDGTPQSGFMAHWYYAIPHIIILILAIMSLIEHYKIVDLESKFEKKKFLKALLYLTLGIISFLNTNSNPVIFIERIFMPIKIGSGTIYYAGLIALILTYKGIKILAETFEWRIYKRRFLIFLLTIFIISFTRDVCTEKVRTFKSSSIGLSSIYCDYEQQVLLFEKIDNNKAMINVKINLENLSPREQQFNIKVKVPKQLKQNLNIDEFTLLNNDGEIATYNIKGYNMEVIDVEFYIDLNNYKELDYRWTSDFEFSLYNDKEKLRFGKRYIWNDLLKI